MARLTTHVLDTSRGVPAGGMRVELYALSSDRRLVATVAMNHDGRSDGPLARDDQLGPGVYELVFYVGEYFRRAGVALPDPPFIDEVPVRFGVADRASYYHVPLLVSPWAYSTYRGS